MMGQIYEVTVKAGEDIKAVVTDYVLGQGWESVYITGAVGSVIGMSYTTPVRDLRGRRRCCPPPAR